MSDPALTNADVMYNVMDCLEIDERLRHTRVSSDFRVMITNDPNWETELYRYQSRGLMAKAFNAFVAFHESRKAIIRTIEENRVRNFFQNLVAARREREEMSDQHHRERMMRLAFQRLIAVRRQMEAKREAFIKFRGACRKQQLMTAVVKQLSSVPLPNIPPHTPAMERWTELVEMMVARDGDDVPASEFGDCDERRMPFSRTGSVMSGLSCGIPIPRFSRTQSMMSGFSISPLPSSRRPSKQFKPGVWSSQALSVPSSAASSPMRYRLPDRNYSEGSVIIRRLSSEISIVADELPACSSEIMPVRRHW